MPINGWVNSYGPDDALRIELEHELGVRVENAIEDEALGYGAIFDLMYEEYMAQEGQA